MRKISARNIGLLTGGTMIAISLATYAITHGFDNAIQYVVYATYVAGILWAIFALKKESGDTAGFRQYFAEGFRCFIVVTLLMVVFTILFILLNPDLKQKMAELVRADFSKSKDLTPAEVEKKVDEAKRMYLPTFIMACIFSYLAIGALVSAIASGFLGASGKNS